MTARAGMCSKQGDYEGCALVVFRLKKVSESTRKVQNVRQLITQIRQKVFQKGAFPAVIIYLERMVTIMKRFYTAESVTEGHPDKLCDLIADSILDACLKEDENSRVACEVLATKRNIIVAGEITSRFEPQVFEIIKKVLESAGYEAEEIHMDLLKPDCVPDESAGGENWRILHGDTLKLVKGFQPGIFDAVITDPPYASGGTKQNERNRTTNQKYSSMKAENALPDFDGDNKDQRSWTHWMAEWLYDVRKACKRGAPICLFIDWRQYPSITDALQWAGWIWRGTAVWDKGNSRPQKGRFRQQAEYIVWGSNGPMPINRPVSCLPGVFRYGNPQNRIHVTEKPLQLMKDVIQICEPGGLILDPFAGAGTTILAAAESGFQAVGIEVTDAYYKLGSDRVRIALEAGEEAENKEPQ